MIRLCLSSYDIERRSGPAIGSRNGSTRGPILAALEEAETGRNSQTGWAPVIQGTQLVQEHITDYCPPHGFASKSSFFSKSADRMIAPGEGFLAQHQDDREQLITLLTIRSTRLTVRSSFTPFALHRHSHRRLSRVSRSAFELPYASRNARTRPRLITLDSAPNPISTTPSTVQARLRVPSTRMEQVTASIWPGSYVQSVEWRCKQWRCCCLLRKRCERMFGRMVYGTSGPTYTATPSRSAIPFLGLCTPATRPGRCIGLTAGLAGHPLTRYLLCWTTTISSISPRAVSSRSGGYALDPG